MDLIVNKPAPTFALPDQEGVLRKLSDFKGQWVLLYFYPKDDTPGCTKEACSMRDNFPHFAKLSAIVLGISADSVESHKKFAEKYGLPFTLLADKDKTVINKYGAYGEKSMYGRKFFGINRMSALNSPDGNIAKVYAKVKLEQHAREVLEDIKSLQKVS